MSTGFPVALSNGGAHAATKTSLVPASSGPSESDTQLRKVLFRRVQFLNPLLSCSETHACEAHRLLLIYHSIATTGRPSRRECGLCAH